MFILFSSGDSGIWSFHLRASNVFNSRNELSTRGARETRLGVQKDKSSISLRRVTTEPHATFLHLLSCPDPGVMVAIELLEARQRDKRCCAPSWPLSCEHYPHPHLSWSSFLFTNCANPQPQVHGKTEQNLRGGHVP